MIKVKHSAKTAILMCLIALNSYAGENSHNPAQTSTTVVSESHASTSTSVSNNITGTSPSIINFNADSTHDASTAIAPNVTNNVKCPIISQDSKGFSVFFASFSGTTGYSVVGLCYALERGDFVTADKMMCDLDKVYAKSNVKCMVAK